MLLSMVSSPQTEALRSANMLERNRAWRVLFDAHFDDCYRLVRRSGVLEADAEEIAQKAFLVAHRRLAAGLDVDNVGGWLRRIVLHVVREHYRWRRVRRMKSWMLGTTPGATPAATMDPEYDAERRQLQQRIHAVMGELSSKLREALVLTEIEGLRPQEAADVLGVPVNTVRSRRRLAAEEFRRRWRDANEEPKP